MTAIRPFLKWPGGKFRLLDHIKKHLDSGERLIEPFVGSGAVFLNTSYKKYLLADTNPHLINLYQHIQQEGAAFIEYGRSFFTAKNNTEKRYYTLRKKFNRCHDDDKMKSALFLYLNRHCYNGLCRYNSKSEFNSPFGLYKKPYFPEKELHAFHEAAKTAEFTCSPFDRVMKKAKSGDIIYCDPPYAPLSKTANFTHYFAKGFHWEDQTHLVEWAGRLAQKGIPVLISNHDTGDTRRLYRAAGAKTTGFKAPRTISCNAVKRNRIKEILAVFPPAQV